MGEEMYVLLGIVETPVNIMIIDRVSCLRKTGNVYPLGVLYRIPL